MCFLLFCVPSDVLQLGKDSLIETICAWHSLCLASLQEGNVVSCQIKHHSRISVSLNTNCIMFSCPLLFKKKSVLPSALNIGINVALLMRTGFY